jgi:hypothetical protein
MVLMETTTMAMNRVQFQPSLSMAEFIRQFGTERQCAQALIATHWPGGFRCPHCGDSRSSTFEREGRHYWYCCRRQTTDTAGTIFASTKLPLEIDDAYLGGEHLGKPGRGSPNREPFIAAVQTNSDGKPQKVCFKALRFTKSDIQDWAHRAIDPEAVVVSDALPSVKADLAAEVVHYHAIKTGSGRQAVLHPEFCNVNTVLGNLKTAITGTYHAFDFARYAHRYLAEAHGIEYNPARFCVTTSSR